MENLYQDIIEWIKEQEIAEPDKFASIKSYNINLVASAFGKSNAFVSNIVEKENFSDLSAEERKIVDFYFRLFRKMTRS
jgi:hypothetical protein